MDHLMYQFDVFLPNLITQTTGNYLVLLKPIIQMVEAAGVEPASVNAPLPYLHA